MRRFLLRLASFLRRDRAERDLAREIDAHVQLLEDRFLAKGMSAVEARAAARRAFGGVEQVKEHQRDARSFRWLTGWSLDVRVGGRMLAKYPGMTIVCGLALAFAFAVGALGFELASQYLYPRLHLEDGDRVVKIQVWDRSSARPAATSASDYARWRGGVRAITDVSAFTTLPRTLLIEGADAKPVLAAAMSAAGFRVARVNAALGRVLHESDEQAGASPVVVIGHDVWQRLFGGDPNVIGRSGWLGAERVTIVGVMPAGFNFPGNHDLWLPLRVSGIAEAGRDPSVQAFGRIAPDATLAQAQDELAAFEAATRERGAADRQQAQIVPFLSRQVPPIAGAALVSVQIFLVLLFVLVCGNVGLLMFARAMTRQNELVVRTALGASRARIIGQLVAEALVLAAIAAGVGLVAAGAGLRWTFGSLAILLIPTGQRLPLGFSPTLSMSTFVYVGLLALLSAAIAGGFPAIKATRYMASRLRAASPGGGGYQFGGIWTAVIVCQIAVTMTFPVIAYAASDALTGAGPGPPSWARSYLSATLGVAMENGDVSPDDHRTRVRSVARELEDRLEAEPEVDGVTFADYLPVMSHPMQRIEIEQVRESGEVTIPHQRVNTASVAVDFFDVFGAQVLAGRGFEPADLSDGSPAVIVTEAFVREVLGSTHAIGRRLRYSVDDDDPAADRPWHEIVGVVRNTVMSLHSSVGLYHPGIARQSHLPVRVAIHVTGDPAQFAARLRTIAATTNPALQLWQITPLDQVGESERLLVGYLFVVTGTISAVAFMLSVIGVYSVLSFTVTQRTREIGIRMALGGSGRRLVATVFRRPLTQVAMGIVGGAVMILALTAAGGQELDRQELMLLPATFGTLMAAVCALAGLVPLRRALRVQPTEALRAEG